jgi:GT2 family glycosyltransferase
MAESSPIDLSVIVVNRNTADLLLKCLDHIFRSELDEEPEVIVVDNGSSDDSVSRVRSAYPRVIVLEAGANLGFAAANNRAIRQASGRFLLLVNTDALLDRECAGVLLSLMKSDPRIGMAGPQLLYPDGTRQTSYEAVPTLATETLNRSLLKRLFPARFPGKNREIEGPVSVEALIGAIMMIRTEALDKLRGFDEDYFFFLEETDLAVRMRGNDWLVMHEPRAQGVHLQGGSANTYQAAARIEFYRSRYLFFRKHYGSAAMWLLRGALTVNLTLNVLSLGLVTALSLGMVSSSTTRLNQRVALWIWHLKGCPRGQGLPRD